MVFFFVALQISQSSDRVIQEYHRRCIELNSDIQLIRDRISQVIHLSLLSVCRPPPLQSLYCLESEGLEEDAKGGKRRYEEREYNRGKTRDVPIRSSYPSSSSSSSLCRQREVFTNNRARCCSASDYPVEISPDLFPSSFLSPNIRLIASAASSSYRADPCILRYIPPFLSHLRLYALVSIKSVGGSDNSSPSSLSLKSFSQMRREEEEEERKGTRDVKQRGHINRRKDVSSSTGRPSPTSSPFSSSFSRTLIAPVCPNSLLPSAFESSSSSSTLPPPSRSRILMKKSHPRATGSPAGFKENTTSGGEKSEVTCSSALAMISSSSSSDSSSSSSSSVFSGLILRSSHEDLKRLEETLEGRWGSFNLLEQWLNDSMKWQWRDAMMERDYKKSHAELEVWRRTTEKRILDTVDLRLQHLWLGRMQALEKESSEQLDREFLDLLIQKVPGMEEVLESLQSKKGESHQERGREMGSRKGDREEEENRLALLKRSSRLRVEIESALMASEDMRSRLIDITTSDIYRPMMYARDLWIKRYEDSTTAMKKKKKNPEALFTFLEEELTRQLRDARHLREQYESEEDISFEPETVQEEYLQIEAASSMLQAELMELQQRRTLRQQQLLDLRTTARNRLEKITALFDDEQKSMKSIEDDWRMTEKLLERLENLLNEPRQSEGGDGKETTLERLLNEMKRLREENLDLRTALEDREQTQQLSADKRKEREREIEKGGGSKKEGVWRDPDYGRGDKEKKKEEMKRRKLLKQQLEEEEKAEMQRKKEEELRRKKERKAEESQKKKEARKLLLKSKSSSSLLSGWTGGSLLLGGGGGGSASSRSRRVCQSLELGGAGADLPRNGEDRDDMKSVEEEDREVSLPGKEGREGRENRKEEEEERRGIGGGEDTTKNTKDLPPRGRHDSNTTTSCEARDDRPGLGSSQQEKKRSGGRGFGSLFSWGRSSRRSSSTPATLKQVRRRDGRS